ncbi:MAG: hypothetical protein RLZ91_617, partial [Bacteroidota bacterium]
MFSPFLEGVDSFIFTSLGESFGFVG